MKKILAGIISAALVMAASVPVMAESSQVFVNFICDGQNSGKLVNVGSNVTAPAVPLHGGFTFCGFDKSLYNIRENTTFYAVYVDNNLGEAAIAAKKASLPTPAVSPTTVADPNAAASAAGIVSAAASAVGTLTAAAPAASDAMAVVQQNIAAAQNAVAAAQAGTQTPAAPTAAAPAAQAPAAAAPAAQAPAAAAPAATAPAAVQTPAAPAVTIPASVLPSWATPMNGVDLKGAAEVYKYWKTVKNTDDATIQSNWGALLNHYAGHGTQGW